MFYCYGYSSQGNRQIFYNDVIFEPVLKALKVHGLSVFRWLELISVAIMESKVKGLFDNPMGGGLTIIVLIAV